MTDQGRIIIVSKPLASEGVGEALRAAYNPPVGALPRNIADCLARLG